MLEVNLWHVLLMGFGALVVLGVFAFKRSKAANRISDAAVDKATDAAKRKVENFLK